MHGMIKGANNGTFGYGMGRGCLFPPSMNGPLGYMNYPLPQNISFPATLNSPKYNAQGWNGPSYNESAFSSIMGPNNNGMILFSPK
jgi:hypothetical protein